MQTLEKQLRDLAAAKALDFHDFMCDNFSSLDDREQQEQYNSMLDECYEPIDICGHNYDPSRALMMCDPVAYHVGLSDYFSTEDFIEIECELYRVSELEDYLEQEA
jgi:hypothetical protein